MWQAQVKVSSHCEIRRGGFAALVGDVVHCECDRIAVVRRQNDYSSQPLLAYLKPIANSCKLLQPGPSLE